MSYVTHSGSRWLRRNWTGGAYDQNPVLLGAYRGGQGTIHIQEVI